MRSDLDSDEIKQGGWISVVDQALGDALDSADFDARFVRYLVRLLDQTGFSNLSFAILRSAVDVANSSGEREEFDGLVDLGIQLMSREGRRLSLEKEGSRDG